MTITMTENQPIKLPKMQGDIGFSLGFFCGAMLAAIGVYLTASPEGKKLRHRLATEFNEHQHNLILSSVIPNDKKSEINVPEIAVMARSWIKKIRVFINQDAEKTISKSVVAPAKRKHHFKQK